MTEGAQNSEQGQDPFGGLTDQVGQVTHGVQDSAGQAVGQVGQAAEGLTLGTQLLGESTIEAGQTQHGGEDQEGGPQDLSQQIQEQTVSSAQDFFGESLGKLKGQLQSERAELESLVEQIPDEEAQAQIQEIPHYCADRGVVRQGGPRSQG